ncbi:hypothetical protein [Vibrio phage JSF12]|uniref:Uncharacterized protein n=2 Tax=Jesfedecavirus TaxID=2560156 RepID=A0A2D0Z8G9_9CAUD|nr:hypothetical protein FDI98_gp074 [Vibrio phage JSF10]YP_009794806.1 hypothetical protein HOS35_gp123 [Vibrio phage JSF12]ASV43458.1 hypothetical protein [Vibrio phage JSF10]ASV43641.1 hypothetical protein [Vibrio phage JSF12]
MKVNVNGVWKDSKPYVNVNGIWVPVNTVWTNVQGVWKPAYRSEYIHTITSNTLNFNLFNTIGIPEEDIITLVIHVYSNSASQVALDIGNAYTGKTVNIINKGHIYGAGGAASAAKLLPVP